MSKNSHKKKEIGILPIIYIYIGEGKMAYINEQELNELRSNVDIVDVISSYIPLTLKGKNFFGVCPFHQDHSPSMSVSK